MKDILMIKRGLSKICSESEKEIISKINDKSIKVVSFDLFDTLVNRFVSNHDYIFRLLEKKYNDKYSCNDNITKIRIIAEKQARKNSIKEEISLEDIYDNFPSAYKDRIVWLMQKEIELEENVCVKNLNTYQLYEEALKSKKKVYIITDTYLPKKCIENILSKNGFSNYDSLYISSELGCTKRSSNLFKKFHNDTNYMYCEHLHIGDAIRSDYLVPRLLKISCSLIARKRNNTFILKKTSSISVSSDVLINYIKYTSGYDNYYQRIGYEIVGPLLYGYVTWLKNELVTRNIHKVFFLAREGILLNNAFETINGTDNNMDLNIEKNVLRVSRKATTTPLGYSEEALQQRTNIMGYLNRNGFKGKVAIADVGWRGTIQKNLQKIVGNEAYIQGFYYGIIKKKNDSLLRNADAYAFKPNNSGDKALFNIIMSSPSLIELFFLSTDGTTESYNDKYEPILGTPEQNNEVNDEINKLQEAALNFVRYFSKSIEKLNVKMDFTAEDVFIPYESMIRNRCGELARHLAEYNHVDLVSEKFLPEHELSWYLLNPNSFISDFRKSGAKVIFLKKILRIRLPYVEIVSAIRKIFD